MSVIGKGKNDVVQLRNRQDRWFGKEKRARFLDELEASCNVTRASAAAGVCRESAHRLRRTDPAFAAEWTLAIDAGCERIRAELLARALGTADPANNDEHPAEADRTFIPSEPMSDEMKLKVLQVCRAAKEGRMHNPNRRYPLGSRSPEEALASLIAKLERAERRVAGEE
jgi:hypothetical protein